MKSSHYDDDDKTMKTIDYEFTQLPPRLMLDSHRALMFDSHRLTRRDTTVYSCVASAIGRCELITAHRRLISVTQPSSHDVPIRKACVTAKNPPQTGPDWGILWP